MKKSELFKKIDKKLWEDWDPIGVKGFGGSSDEYGGYVPSIVKLLEENADVLKITKLLYQHSNQNMGLSTELEQHSYVAEKLKKLIE